MGEFAFHMGRGGSFLSRGAPHGGASVLMGGGFEKNCQMGAGASHPTMGNPDFWPKCIMFELKKYRGVLFHDTEG